ncbi:MAG: hypothetical protein ACLFQV_02720 [Vulcanimicrobiota bacterium]
MPSINKLQKKLDIMIRMLTEGVDIQSSPIENGYILDIPVKCISNNEKPIKIRRQFVYVTYGRQSPDGEELYQVFTVCGPAQPRLYKLALQLNMEISMGALAVSKVNVMEQNLKRSPQVIPQGIKPTITTGQANYFVIVDTYLVDEINIEKLKTALTSIASSGDKFEKMLVGKDIN